MTSSKLFTLFYWPFLISFAFIFLSGLSLYQVFVSGNQKDAYFQEQLEMEQAELMHLTELLSLRNQLKLKLGEVLFHDQVSSQYRTFKELNQIRENIVSLSERLQELATSEAEKVLLEKHAQVLELGIDKQFYYQDLVLEFASIEEARTYYHTEVRPIQDYADVILSDYYGLVKKELKALNQEYQTARNEIQQTFELSLVVTIILLLVMGGLVLWFAGLARSKFVHYAEDLESEVQKQTYDLQKAHEKMQVSMEELEKERNAAERANRTKSEFLASMSHELRTPLNSVLGFAQFLSFDETLSEEQKDSLHEIEKAGRHLLALIDDVLDLSRVESGNIDLSIEPVSLEVLFEECFSLMRPVAEKRGIKLNAGTVRNLFVRADQVRLKQVLLNLISNAVKYNEDNGRVEANATLSEQGLVEIDICDTGIGVVEEKRDQLFQPFNRLGLEGGTIEGSGVGLSITKTLIELMGGEIVYRPNSPQGSCFTVSLRSEETRRSGGQVSEMAEDSASNPDSVAYKTVLYIEDNPANLKLVTHILASYEHIKLFSAHEPFLGLELAKTYRPDLVLLDINMPDMNGYEVLQTLRETPVLADTPVLALTASVMPDEKERAQQAGFDDFITKPIDVAYFLSAIHERLN